MAKIKEIIGNKYGKLLVVDFHSERGNNNQIMYSCKCDCGNLHITSGESIRSGKSKSCGCNRKNPPNKEIDREYAIWRQLYKSTIEKRNKKWKVEKNDIDLDNFISLSKEICFYCGIEPTNIATDRHRKTKEERLVVKYNGIDRINSNKHYSLDNIVPCCKYCNTAKNIMSVDEFKQWIKRVYDYNFKQSEQQQSLV